MGELPHIVGQSMSGQLMSPITSTVLAEEKGLLKYERSKVFKNWDIRICGSTRTSTGLLRFNLIVRSSRVRGEDSNVQTVTDQQQATPYLHDSFCLYKKWHIQEEVPHHQCRSLIAMFQS